ncbi:MAG TPA: CcoQ/FixQ family Cbb3-type cytochrome c oxidase assembly chaperone [Fibrobacteria bacterium]|nr:CcoQ/FixQ family Cbb3-type cytochrome c oxidase assembly chaperone [Fibrobacteria bacterium]
MTGEATDLMIFPKIGLILFFGFFVGLLVWVYRRRGRKIYDKESMIPFDEAPEAQPPIDEAPKDEP